MIRADKQPVPNYFPLWAKFVFGEAGTVFIGVDMDPGRVKSAPGAIELNRNFGAETDLLTYSDGHVFIRK